jgi:hypothetical protein
MRKMSALAVLVFVVSGLVLAAWRVEAQARVITMPSAEVSLTLGAIQVMPDSSTVSFTATNTGSKSVRSYSVSAFWFQPRGRLGFTTQVQRPSTSLGMGQSHQATMSVDNRVSLGSETSLIVVVKTVTFDDGTSWNDDNVIDHVNQRARELNLP